MGDCLKKTLEKVEEASNMLFKLLPNNYMVANRNKCHSPKSISEEVSVKIENKTIKNIYLSIYLFRDMLTFPQNS